jgi:hypothetical protein
VGNYLGHGAGGRVNERSWWVKREEILWFSVVVQEQGFLVCCGARARLKQGEGTRETHGHGKSNGISAQPVSEPIGSRMAGRSCPPVVDQ